MPMKEGCYYIYNRVLSPKGEKLYLTFNGEKKTITCTEKGKNDENLQWQIKKFDAKTWCIIPVPKESLTVAWGTGVATCLPATKEYVWIIEETTTGYMIWDGKRTQVWCVNAPCDKTDVYITWEAPREAQRWCFENIDN